MNGWLVVLTVVCIIFNGLGVEGGRRALSAATPDAESRAPAWYMIARSAAISTSALIGGIGLFLAWPFPVAGWVYAVAAVTVIVQALDMPVWLSRGMRGWAAGAAGCALIVLALGVAALMHP